MAKKKAKRQRNDRRRKNSGEQQPDETVSLAEYQLILFQAGDDYIGRELVLTVQDKLDQVIDTPKEGTAIDLWIDSGGGDAHAAFKLYLELKSRCARFRVAVPDYAKSAATLLAISADELYLSSAADLGPLDVQIEHPDREGRNVSALAGANALQHLAKLGPDLTLATGPLFIRLTGLPRADILRETLRFSSDILGPVLSKLDPQLIHEAAEALKVTRLYAERMLGSRQGNQLSKKEMKVISSALVSAYPTHGYVIDKKELENLGVASKLIEEHPLWAKIKEIYKTFARRAENSILELVQIEAPPGDVP